MERFPEIAKELDFEKNNKTPDEVTYGSSMMAAWICPKGHSYKAIVSDRTGKKKVGCSFCRYQRMSNTMKKKTIAAKKTPNSCFGNDWLKESVLII